MVRRIFPVPLWTVLLVAMVCGASPVMATPPVLLSVVSRMTHGTAGNFDIQLPMGAAASATGVECRSTANGLSIVFAFDQIVKTGTGTFSGTGTLGTAVISGNTITLPITGVTDNQTCRVSCDFVQNAGGETLVSGFTNFRILFCDVTGDGIVTSSDVNKCRAAVSNGLPVNGATFRYDTNVDGALTSSDMTRIRTAASISSQMDPSLQGADPKHRPDHHRRSQSAWRVGSSHAVCRIYGQ